MALNIASLSLILFSVIIIVLGIVKVHEYPGTIAKARNHPQHDAIVACSLLGLLMFPLWMFALLWAYGGVIGTPLPEPAKGDSAGPGTPDGTPESDEA